MFSARARIHERTDITNMMSAPRMPISSDSSFTCAQSGSEASKPPSPREVGDEAGSDILEPARERADELAEQQIAGEPAEDQHAAERDDERRDFRVGDQHALHRADRRADRQADDDDDRIRPFRVDHQRAGDGADEADRRADREIDVAADDDQQHPQRHDDDVGILHHQIGDVDRRDGGVILGDEIEEPDDQQQRDQQAVVAQVVLPQLRAHLLRGGGVGGDGRARS